MNKAVLVLVPTALFAFAIFAIVQGIKPMVAQERNNKFHAMLIDCKYVGKMEKHESVLLFDCNNKIELVKEIKW